MEQVPVIENRFCYHCSCCLFLQWRINAQRNELMASIVMWLYCFHHHLLKTFIITVLKLMSYIRGVLGSNFSGSNTQTKVLRYFHWPFRQNTGITLFLNSHSPKWVYSAHRPLLAHCTCTGRLWGWRITWNEDWQGKPKYSKETCPSATLSTKNPTWPDLGSNPGRRFGKPATNRLSYCAAFG
jgi:hypothetical protein